MENNNAQEIEVRSNPILNKLILFCSVIVITLVSFSAIFIWRIAQGPVSLSFLTPYFESVLSNNEGGYKARLNETTLTWDKNNSLLGLRLKGIKIKDSGSKVVAEIPDLVASLSTLSLIKGEFSPKFLSISKLKLFKILTDYHNLSNYLPRKLQKIEILDENDIKRYENL